MLKILWFGEVLTKANMHSLCWSTWVETLHYLYLVFLHANALTKAFADNKIIVTPKLKCMLGTVENIVGKRKNASFSKGVKW